MSTPVASEVRCRHVEQLLGDWGCGFLMRRVLPLLLKREAKDARADTLRDVRSILVGQLAGAHLMRWRRPGALDPLFTPVVVCVMFGVSGAAACVLLDLYAGMMGRERGEVKDSAGWVREAIINTERAILQAEIAAFEQRSRGMKPVDPPGEPDGFIDFDGEKMPYWLTPMEEYLDEIDSKPSRSLNDEIAAGPFGA